jgi:hypothetical protein
MVKNPVTLTGKHVVQLGDRLFEPINDLLIILSSIGHAVSLMVGGSTHTTPKPVMRLNAHVVGHAFALPMRGPLEHALKGTIPNRIEIGITPLAAHGQPLTNIVAQTVGLASVMNHISRPIFLGYFERYNDWLKDTYGDAVNWPMTLNFARVIRNAVAHGKIRIRNPSAAPVHWHGLSYGYADNGKTVIGTDMHPGDVLALMFEINDELNKLGAPIL